MFGDFNFGNKRAKSSNSNEAALGTYQRKAAPRITLQLEALESRLTPAYSQLPELVSVNSAGTGAGNGFSEHVAGRSLSADGRYEVFDSDSSDLVAGLTDNNNFADVFVRDLWTGVTRCVSVTFSGASTANGYSYAGAISADGRYVAFTSNATNLISSNPRTQIYRRDMLTNTTILISINNVGSDGGSGNSGAPTISADGNVMAFHSDSNDLVVGDSGFTNDVFVRNVSAGTMSMLSTNSSGSGGGDSGSLDPVISANGSAVVFRSSASNLVAGINDLNGANYDVFRRDLTTNATTIVSIGLTGLDSGDMQSDEYSISDDGLRVAFRSNSSNLVANDANIFSDVFVRDYSTLTTTPVSVNLTGVTPNSSSDLPVISGNGVYVAFRSGAIDLTPGVTTPVGNIYRRNLNAGTTLLVTPDSSGTDGGNLGSGAPVISADGSFVAYASSATDLVAGDTNGSQDIFVRDIAAGVTSLISKQGGTPSDNHSYSPSIAANGSVVTFDSWATNLVAGMSDTNGDDDLFAVFRDPLDTTAPTVTGMYFDGTTWTPAFRAAAGDSTYGYPAQTGAGQSTTMPWSTVNTIYIKFSENVVVLGGFLGIRGVNNPLYNAGTFSYDSVNFVAKWTLAAPAFDTDWVIADLDGSSGSAVTDIAGNKLAGTWTENSSTFPTAGSAGVNFKYRFKIAIGDADRNGQVRNPDTNLVRANLFLDAGAGGYNIYTDIDSNGLTRNADLNAVRSHLFIDPPAGPGPSRPLRGTLRAGTNTLQAGSDAWRAGSASDRNTWNSQSNVQLALANQLDFGPVHTPDSVLGIEYGSQTARLARPRPIATANRVSCVATASDIDAAFAVF